MDFEDRILSGMCTAKLKRRDANIGHYIYLAFCIVFCLLFYLGIIICFAKAGYSQVPDSAQECLYLSEIMYNPTGDDSLLEFVEVCNKCNSSVSLAGVALEGVSYAFSNDTYALPKSALIVPKSCFNEGDFCSQNQEFIESVFCCFSGTLTNTFKTISLAYESAIFDSFSYTANSKENYSTQRFSNKSEFSLPYGSPGICYFSEGASENLTNESIEDGMAEGDGGDTGEGNGSDSGEGIYDEFDNDSGNNTRDLSNQTTEGGGSFLNLTNSTDLTNNTGLSNTTNLSNTSDLDDVSNLSNLTNLTNLTNTSDLTNLTNMSNLTNMTNITNLSNSSDISNVSNNSNENQMEDATNESQTGGNASQTQFNESCFCTNANISIDAPMLINESSTSYTISIEVPNSCALNNCTPYSCSYYYKYEVLDLCGNVIRELRESSVFGKKSFTPTSDCCAYKINAYLFENTNLSLNASLMANATRYLIKPSSCERSRNTTSEARLFENGGNVNMGFNVIEPLSVDEQIEKVSFTLKARRENLKSLQTFLKGSLNVTSDYSKLILGIDEDIFCKVDPRIYAIELSGKINSQSFSEEIDIDCSDYLEESNEDDKKDNILSDENPKGNFNNASYQVGVVSGILKSLVDIKSFYTLKKNFSENISLYFNMDYNQSLLGDIYGYVLEEPFSISPGKNEIVFPFKKAKGKLYLLIFNQTDAFGLKELNYSFEGFKTEEANQSDNGNNSENSFGNSASSSALSSLLKGNKKAILGLEVMNDTLMINDTIIKNLNSKASKANNSDANSTLLTGNIVSNAGLKPNDVFLSILGIGTFSGLSYGLYKFSKK